uniref:virulence factor n=1 Tax=Castellaniella defragrans TaxID=75697 RepID=UPI0033429027
MNKFVLTAAAALFMACGQNAMAEVNVGISIGIPGLMYPAPGYYYEPPPRHIHRPRVVVVPEPVYVPAPRWGWSDRGRGHQYRAGPPGHRRDGGRNEYHRGPGRWDR